jgi:hypothetical protein
MASPSNAPASRQPNRGSKGNAPTQSPRGKSAHPTGGGRGGKTPNAHQPQENRGFIPQGKSKAPGNGSGNKVPQGGF